MPVKVSVLMPVLNEEVSVVDAVTSVLGQTGVDLELLVIDGCSVDGTSALVREVAGRDPRVHLLVNDKTTIPAGLNVGLRHSAGEFVARVDGHSAISAGYFEQAIAGLRRDVRLAGVGGKRFGVSSTPVGRAIALALSSKFGVGNSINHYATEAQLTDHASFAVYRADVAREVGGWDESLLVNEDVDFDHRILQAGHLIGFDPAMEIYWQVRSSVPDLVRQYRRYGRGKAAMVKKNGYSAMRLRHALPPVAVTGVVVVAVASLRKPRLLLLGLPYVAATLVASVQAWRRRVPSGRTSLAALPLAFASMHFAWGLGFMEGLLGRRPAQASGSDATVAPTTTTTTSTTVDTTTRV